MATVRSLITRFGFEVDSASQSRAEGAVNRLSNMLQGLAAFASLNALAKLGDSTQSLEARIGMLDQTTTSANEAFNEIAKNAVNARQSLDSYGTLYVRIANAGKEYLKTQEDVLGITNTISQALVVGGASAAESSSVMLQFSQALGSGVMQGGEFNAMAEAASEYMDQLAIALDIPRKNLKKMAAEGQLTSEKVIEGTKKMSDYFEKRFLSMPMTTGQAFTIIHTKFAVMLQNMNSESMAISKIATFFVESFKWVEKKLTEFIKDIGGGTNALKLFGIAVAALLGPFALAGLITMLGAILSPAGLLFAALITLGLLIDDVITYLNGGNSAFGEFIESSMGGLLIAIAGGVAAFRILQSNILVTIGQMVWLAATSLFAAAQMALSWLIAFWPIGLLIVALTAVGAAIYLLWDNWDKVMGWMGEKVQWVIDQAKKLAGAFGFGDGLNATVTGVNQGQTAGAAGAGGAQNIDARQNITITVPEGTTAEQQAMIKGTAAQAYQQNQWESVSRDLSLMGP